jgi:hypothetical protein
MIWVVAIGWSILVVLMDWPLWVLFLGVPFLAAWDIWRKRP